MFDLYTEFWTIPIDSMTYIGSQNYTNVVVGKHRTQMFEVVLLLLLWSFDVCVVTNAQPLLFSAKCNVQVYLNVMLRCHACLECTYVFVF